MPRPTGPPKPESDALWAAYQADRTCENRNRLIVLYLPMTADAAHSVRQHHPTIRRDYQQDELAAMAVFGLFQAVDRYNPNYRVGRRHPTFERFAWPRLVGAIIDAVRVDTWGPQHAKEAMPATCLRPVSLDATIDDDDDTDLDIIASSDPDPADQVVAACTNTALAAAVDCLCGRELEVIKLNDYQRVTMKEIARRWGVHESRVSQIRTAAIRRLRAVLYMWGELGRV